MKRSIYILAALAMSVNAYAFEKKADDYKKDGEQQVAQAWTSSSSQGGLGDRISCRNETKFNQSEFDAAFDACVNNSSNIDPGDKSDCDDLPTRTQMFGNIKLSECYKNQRAKFCMNGPMKTWLDEHAKAFKDCLTAKTKTKCDPKVADASATKSQLVEIKKQLDALQKQFNDAKKKLDDQIAECKRQKCPNCPTPLGSWNDFSNNPGRAIEALPGASAIANPGVGQQVFRP